MTERFTQSERMAIIGGSDAGTIAGFNPWATPFDLYMEKKGIVQPRDETPEMRAGTLLEPAIATQYAKAIGEDDYYLKPIDLIIHPAHKFIVGHPDRYVFARNNGDAPRHGLEIKSTNPFNMGDWGEEWTDQIPKMYLMQVQQYMGIDGLDYYDVAVTAYGRDIINLLFNMPGDVIPDSILEALSKMARPQFYRVFRNEQVIDPLFELEIDFKRRLDEEDPPEVSAGERTREYLNQKFPKDMGVEVVVEKGDSFLQTLIDLRDARQKLAELEDIESGLKNRIMNRMGEASKLISPIGTITWKTSKDGEKTDWEKIALAAGADAKLIKEFTAVKPGVRSFRVNLK